MVAPAIATLGQDTIEERVVAIVAGLVEELGGPAARMTVSARVSLERDLGIGSLERVELLVRLEEAFGVRLPDSAMTAAESLRDLARAVLAAEPPVAGSRPAAGAVPGPGTPAPPSAATLIEVLDWHAQRVSRSCRPTAPARTTSPVHDPGRRRGMPDFCAELIRGAYSVC